MVVELNLSFPDSQHVIVSLGGKTTGNLPFANPVSGQDQKDLAWYVETYGAHSLGDPDDSEAQRIVARLPLLGKALFDAVFAEREAERLFNQFQDAEGQQRLITVTAEHPAILALPWELLHDASAPDGTYLFHEKLSIRRRVAGADIRLERGVPAFPRRPGAPTLTVDDVDRLAEAMQRQSRRAS